VRRRAGNVADWTRHVFKRDQMTWHLDDYRCSAEVRSSLQETAPRKTAENTVEHCGGGVDSVPAKFGGRNSTSLWVVSC